MADRHVRIAGLVALAAWALSAAPASAQWQIESKDGQASLKIGLLAQPQLETLETVDQQATSTNLFVRRVRLMFGGTLGERWSFFVETDSPNIGKGNTSAGATSGVKEAGNIFIQDAFVTYTQNDAFKIDAGMFLLPHSRNGTQSAATLLPVDYGPYTFLGSGPSAERFGRDYGVQLRGYPAKQRLEYRLALAQGVRGTEARNPLRVSGRAVYYPFGAETGYFYGGTFQGTKKQAGIGGSFDAQKDFRIYSADGFLELPTVRKTQGFTVQVNWMRYDGGDMIAALPRQNTWLLEAGYHLLNHRLTPFVQYQARDFADTATPDQSHLQAGAAWWLKGHQRNLKISVGRLQVAGEASRTQVLAQLQIFYF
jgi:Phosphate-selective porin O and P